MIRKQIRAAGLYVLARAKLEYRLKEYRNGKHRLFIFTRKNAVGVLLNSLFFIFQRPLKMKSLKNAMIRISKNQCKKLHYFEKLTEGFEINSTLNGHRLNKIPKKGPLIFYANHPFSGMDVFTLAAELIKVRPDLKILTASYLANFPGFKNWAFIIDVGADQKKKEKNKKVYLEINEHIRQGKSLLIFPAGYVSSWEGNNKFYAIDPPWKEGIIRFGQNAPDTSFIPVYIEGEPSKTFLKFHYRAKIMSNIYVIREFSNHMKTKMHFHFGHPINIKELADLNTEEKLGYLRATLYKMGTSYFTRTYGLKKSISPLHCKLFPYLTRFESDLMQLMNTRPKLSDPILEKAVT